MQFHQDPRQISAVSWLASNVIVTWTVSTNYSREIFEPELFVYRLFIVTVFILL